MTICRISGVIQSSHITDRSLLSHPPQVCFKILLYLNLFPLGANCAMRIPDGPVLNRGSVADGASASEGLYPDFKERERGDAAPGRCDPRTSRSTYKLDDLSLQVKRKCYESHKFPSQLSHTFKRIYTQNTETGEMPFSLSMLLRFNKLPIF